MTWHYTYGAEIVGINPTFNEIGTLKFQYADLLSVKVQK